MRIFDKSMKDHSVDDEGRIVLKKTMMSILACPVCKYHPLELKVAKEDEKEVISGTLLCKNCGLSFLIEEGIPNMLPPGTANS